MINKPKNVKRLITYYPTKGERCHMAIVREAKKQGLKHPGSRPMHILRNIVKKPRDLRPVRIGPPFEGKFSRGLHRAETVTVPFGLQHFFQQVIILRNIDHRSRLPDKVLFLLYIRRPLSARDPKRLFLPK